MSLRKVLKNRGLFPNDVSMRKLLYLAVNNISKKWTILNRNWKLALNQFTIIFEGRMPQSDRWNRLPKIYYTLKRRHSYLKQVSPYEFEKASNESCIVSMKSGEAHNDTVW